ncbi:DUF6266 family protein [Pedobacter frigoris]|uniref:DUF6266 family protein n=1 Tax=Pedobacter frigoris TaxID=2571272 RepID=UPI00292EB1FB|nr:DUF6266 family protein [Pedobacter frigoris]
MGIQHLGAFGGFQGKAGALVGHRVNGQNVITGVPYPSTKPPTQSQLDVRSIFRVMIDFIRPINSFLQVGFKHVKKEKQSAFNYAFRENYDAVAKVFPFAIDYTKIVLSKGHLDTPYIPEVASAAGAVVFEWLANVGMGGGAATDRISVLVYNPAKDAFVGLMQVVPRSALTYTLALPADFTGDMVSCWISAVSADGKVVSDSAYLGQVTVA